MDGLDLAILEAARSLTGDGDVSCAEVLEAVGGDQVESYARMVRLMDPKGLWFPLLEGIGNIGDRDVEPMWPTHVRCQMNPVGHAVLDDPEHPVLLVNGDLYRGGTRAPYAPNAVTAALRQAVAHRPTTAHTETCGGGAGGGDDAPPIVLGLPAFPIGCVVEVDLEQGLVGGLMAVTLRAEVSTTSVSGDRVALLVRALPPGAGGWSMMRAVDHRTSRHDLPVFDGVAEVSPAGFDHASRWVLVDPALEPAARMLIDRVPEMVQTLRVEPPDRAAERLVRWVADHSRDETLRAADQLDGPWQVSGEMLARRTSPVADDC